MLSHIDAGMAVRHRTSFCMSTTLPAVHPRLSNHLASRVWTVALVGIIVLECLPFWLLPYFPSQDGPSHFHNAAVLADYATAPAYQEYYRIVPFRTAGNMLTQYLLAGILKVTGSFFAEKLLLSGYVAFFCLSFLYLLRTVSPHASYFSMFSGVFVANWFLYMGFWNFLFSTCLLILTVGYYLRRAKEAENGGGWRVRHLIVLTVAGFLLYFTHAVGWVGCIVAVGALGFPRILSFAPPRDHRTAPGSLRQALRQYAAPICALLPPAGLMLVQFGHSNEAAGCAIPSFQKLLWPLYTLSFLSGVAASEMMLRNMALFALLAPFVWLAILLIRTRKYRRESTGLLLASAACVFLAVAGPDCVGRGTYIHGRLGLFACIFYVVWLASALPAWPRLALNGLAAFCCALALITFAVRFPILSEMSRSVSAFASVGASMRPGSTVLSLDLRPEGETTRFSVDPFLHVAGILTRRQIIDLRNYEASTDLFVTEFRGNRAPSPALGTVKELQSSPPVFDIARYERETAGRVDYVLLYGRNHADRAGSGSMQVDSYTRPLSGYTVVRSEQAPWVGGIKLYKR